ncbi:hypothetical protein D3C78_1569780 [compost metagenome]
MPFIIFNVKVMMFWNTAWRSNVPPTPSATSSQKAVMAALQARSSPDEPEATASTSRPAYIGVRMSATADSSASSTMTSVRQGCRPQWRKVKPRTSLKACPRKSIFFLAITMAWRHKTRQDVLVRKEG